MDKELSYKSKEYRKSKFIIFRHYGKRCNCCGERIHHFLTIDHVNNDGKEHRKEIGKSTDTLYKWIIDNNFPDTVQILCWNCYLGKKKFGECPHTFFKK